MVSTDSQPGPEATVSFLNDRNGEAEDPTAVDPQKVLLTLYVSHFLSTWNSRLFEFGAVLFLAAIFPGTLLWASIYALCRNLAATLFASRVGTYLDRTNRLTSVRHSIAWQRVPVALSCALFLALLHWKDSKLVFWTCFPTAALFACFEKLAIVGNTVAVERDWAIVISEAAAVERQGLNAVMRRIDLGAKLIAPVVVSLIEAYDTSIAVWTVLAWNLTSVILEYYAIAQVYRAVPELAVKTARNADRDVAVLEEAVGLQEGYELADEDVEAGGSEISTSKDKLIPSRHWLLTSLSPWRTYFTSPALFPSVALSLLYLTVLSTGVQYQTYMLSTGYSGTTVALLRLCAVISELAATLFAPMLMHRIGTIRAGLWSINWQLACLSMAAGCFVALEGENGSVAGGILTVGIIASRLGLWGFDLSVQDIVQEVSIPGGYSKHRVTKRRRQNAPSDTRGEFSASEAALQNFFELLSFASTIAFPRPDQFHIAILISLGALVSSASLFAGYVRKERGHLIHASQCFKRHNRGEYQVVD
jgi:solute carrier family 40 (iron-regulated transporter), member 1